VSDLSFRQQVTLRPELGLVLVLYVLLAVIYSLTTPILEASDEISHYPVVQHIATTGELPVQEPGVETPWEQEGSQPPLYYLIGAGLTAWIDTGDVREIRWRNPHAKIGVPLDPDNTNMIIHTEAEQFPWQGTVLAIHIVRLFSVLLGMITVYLAFLLAQEVWNDDDRRWIHLLSVSLVAFNPMFLFISGSVNNDNLTITLGTWVLLLVVRVARHGITLRRSATLAVVGALITLTKISGWTFMPLIGLALLIHVLRNDWSKQAWKESMFTGFAHIGAWLLFSSWWYLRNLRLYGEFLGTRTHVAVVGGRSISFWEVITQEWYSFWVAYWGWFGAVNILFDSFIYWFFAALQIGALVGLVWWVGRTRTDKNKLIVPGLLALQAVVVLGGIIRWTMITMGSQGRLLFPVIGGVSTLTAFGLLWWMPKRGRQISASVIGAAMLLIATVTPFVYIKPAYALPNTVQQLPGSAVPLEAHFEALELVGVETPIPAIEAGGWVPITVYWRLNEATDENYSTFYSVIGREIEEIGKLDTYPGMGTLPTSQMEVGTIYRDNYLIQVEEDFRTPTLIRVLIGVGVFEPDQGYVEIFNPESASGEEVGSVIVDAAVAYPADIDECEQAAGAITGQGQFADLAVLSANVGDDKAFNADDSVEVDLAWDVIGTTPDNWTVFVHLVGEDNSVVAQADGPPLDGDYPTSLWKESCGFSEQRIITIPEDVEPGEYRVMVGLYNADDSSLPRVPVLEGGDSVEAGRIRVTVGQQ